MSFTIGLDIGTVSLKAAVLGDKNDSEIVEKLKNEPIFEDIPDKEEGRIDCGMPLLVTRYQRIKGRPISAVRKLLDDIFCLIPLEKISGIRVVGSGSRLISETLEVNRDNEFKIIAKGMGFLYPSIRTVFEMGGETSKYLLLLQDEETGSTGIVDYETNGDCAAGTGSFIDQQSSRLLFKVEDVGRIVLGAEKSAQIAGRCSVFAKSDMIHAQQRGYQPDEVLKGLCEAVARNFKSAITRTKTVITPIAFVGGVAVNKGVFWAMKKVFGFEDNEIMVPDYYAWIGAIGAAWIEKQSPEPKTLDTGKLKDYNEESKTQSFITSEPLSLDGVTLLREHVKKFEFPDGSEKVDAYLGVDVGSVSTNLVVIDENGNLIKEIYTWTKARPIEVVGEGLREIERDVGDKIRVRGVGTTGSGRELIGELIGADTINDEITSHKTGAVFIGKELINKKVDTIFEIGGQDSKYISIEDDIVVDFTMNDACAAGTGSFLEERAEELEINIEEEFAKIALSSETPIRLGERCTVFMERDVASFQQLGAKKEDLVAGLAYSVVLNYINRVVRGRKIGDVIFFQGGTAYNDAVAAAFYNVLGKQIIVPPHNGVLGAVGVALLAMKKMKESGAESTFRGFRLDQVEYSLREFTCKACTNFCTIQEFNVEGEKTYWGDKCSERYRKQTRSKKKPVIDDLISLREKLLLANYDGDGIPEEIDSRKTVGLLRSMYTIDHFPFFNTFLTECGFRVLLSEETNREITNDSLDSVVAEPCFPITVSHGHLWNLINKNVDFIFVPDILNAETDDLSVQSFVCAWGQTLPYVLKNAEAFEKYKDKFIIPILKFREGRTFVEEALVECFTSFGISHRQIRSAVRKAFETQDTFSSEMKKLGRKALETLKHENEAGIVLVGRPYNIHDRGVNLNIANKLRTLYGVNVIPLDFLDVDDIDISSINSNMFWSYGKKILRTAAFVKSQPNLHLIYITNFKCGPDSFIKHFIVEASGKPFLSLQFDGHSNDAGTLTRCEAYLQSKKVLD